MLRRQCEHRESSGPVEQSKVSTAGHPDQYRAVRPDEIHVGDNSPLVAEADAGPAPNRRSGRGERLMDVHRIESDREHAEAPVQAIPRPEADKLDRPVDQDRIDVQALENVWQKSGSHRNSQGGLDAVRTASVDAGHALEHRSVEHDLVVLGMVSRIGLGGSLGRRRRRRRRVGAGE